MFALSCASCAWRCVYCLFRFVDADWFWGMVEEEVVVVVWLLWGLGLVEGREDILWETVDRGWSKGGITR